MTPSLGVQVLVALAVLVLTWWLLTDRDEDEGWPTRHNY